MRDRDLDKWFATGSTSAPEDICAAPIDSLLPTGRAWRTVPAGSGMDSSTRIVGADIGGELDRRAGTHLNCAKKEGSETLFALANEMQT